MASQNRNPTLQNQFATLSAKLKRLRLDMRPRQSISVQSNKESMQKNLEL
jgi:hypothetical protein